MAFMALGAIAAMACDAEKASTASATTKAGCCASKSSASTINATMASSKTTTSNGASCSAADKGACAAKLASGQCTINMCLKECQAKHAEICGEAASKHHLTSISIKGMTCANCEGKVRTALMAVEGVNNVIEVCSKAGFAVVCVKNDSKLENESIIKAVNATGFTSEIIPAVAVTTTTTNTTEKPECPAHKKGDSK